jgi:hypothetical protein
VRRSAAGAGVTAVLRSPLNIAFLELIAVKAVATPLPEIIFAWFIARDIRVATPFLTAKSLVVKLAMVAINQFLICNLFEIFYAV